jgi:tripartite-type tricarboxylate transporter receptor subunit TctC
VFPAGTPEPIIKRSSDAFREILGEEAVKQALLRQGVEPRSSSAAEMTRHIETEVAGFKNFITEFGIKPRSRAAITSCPLRSRSER